MTETKLDNTFRIPNFTLKVFQCHIGWIKIGMVVEYVKDDFPTKILMKHNLLEDIEGIFV